MTLFRMLQSKAAIMMFGFAAACSQGEDAAPSPSALPAEQAQSSATQASATRPPVSFIQCRACHAYTEGAAHMVGPNLWGVYGKPAGSFTDFAYSQPMSESGLVWDDATLDAFLQAPTAVVPGTKMAFAGVKDEAMRKEIVDWLKTLNDQAASE